jgi:mono/diheme cytochrome c family protein
VRVMRRLVGWCVGGVVVASVAIVGCSTPTGVAGASMAAARGERFFRAKCNACHPGGGQGSGPAIDLEVAPTFLERGKVTGRHAVPEAEWEPLFAYMTTSFGVAVTAPVAAAPVAAAPVAAAPVAAAPAPAPAATTTTTTIPVAPSATVAGDPAAGAVYFKAKCQKCHPGGSKIAGKVIPGVLVKGGSGKHGVEPGSFDNLMAYLPSFGAVLSSAVAPSAMTAPTMPATTAPTMPATPAPATTATATTTAVGDVAAGAAFYQTKCQKCHPGGSKIGGKTIPGVLVKDGSGKHGVPSAHFDNLMAYLPSLGAIRAGAPPATTTPTPATTTPTPATTTATSSPTTNSTTTAPPPPPPPPPGKAGTIPASAGMVPCTCACQCPPGAPPAALPAACICQCNCAR